MMFKTLAAYGQVVGIASLFPYKWPSSVLYLFDVMETMTSVSDRILNTDCAMEDTNRSVPLTYEKAILYMIGPLCFVICATIFWLCVHCVLTCVWGDKWRRDQKKSRQKKERITNGEGGEGGERKMLTKTEQKIKETKGLKKTQSFFNRMRLKVDNYNGEEWTFQDTKRYLIVSILVAMVILHPTLTRQSLFMFMCVQIEDGSYLRKDVQLECYTEEHITFLLAVGVPGIIACKILFCFFISCCLKY